MKKKFFNLTLLAFILMLTIFSAGCEGIFDGGEENSGLVLPQDYV